MCRNCVAITDETTTNHGSSVIFSLANENFFVVYIYIYAIAIEMWTRISQQYMYTNTVICNTPSQTEYTDRCSSVWKSVNASSGTSWIFNYCTNSFFELEYIQQCTTILASNIPCFPAEYNRSTTFFPAIYWTFSAAPDRVLRQGIVPAASSGIFELSAI